MMLSKDIQAAFGRAAASFDDYSILHTEVRKRLLSRARTLKSNPGLVLDMGAGTCGAAAGLVEAFPKAHLYCLDLTPEMLSEGRDRPAGIAVCADFQALPFRAQSIDLVFSNLAIHWCQDFNRLLWELRVALAPGAAFLFSVFGPRTLEELRDAWASIDSGRHIHEFHDIQDLGDAILAAGFVDPIMDVDIIELTYRNIAGLMRDIKNTGGHNIQVARPRGLFGRQKFARLEACYEAHRSQGVLPATCEIIYGLARAPEH